MKILVKTGYISFIQEIGGGRDADGNIIASTKTPTAFFECNLKVITKEYVRVIDGQAKQASYSIYVNSDKVAIDPEAVHEINLQDNRAKSLGEHQIMNIEYLELSKRIKIVV